MPEIVGELRDILIGQIGNHPFGEHEDLARAGVNIGEEPSPQRPIGEIELDAFEPAARLLVSQPRFFQLDHVREIDLDPAERAR